MAVLVFGYGNPSRGDDALGPMLMERLQGLLPMHPEWGEVHLLTDFQLQPEHALDLAGCSRALFVDASVSCTVPYACAPVLATADFGYTTHAMSPAALLAVFCRITGGEPPPCELLTVCGVSFQLGEPLSPPAAAHLEAALEFVQTWLAST
jgi:hydrogenase maturation protease